MNINYALDLWHTTLTILARRPLPRWKIGDWISFRTHFHDEAVKFIGASESKHAIVGIDEKRLTLECSNSKFYKDGIKEVLDFQSLSNFPAPAISEMDLGDEELVICGKPFKTRRIRFTLREQIFIEINFSESMPVFGIARLQKWAGSQLDVTYEVVSFGTK